MTPDERIADLESRLAMVTAVCETQRAAFMDLLEALEFEFKAMSMSKTFPKGDELQPHFNHFFSRVKDLDITPAAPDVAAFLARIEERGAAKELRVQAKSSLQWARINANPAKEQWLEALAHQLKTRAAELEGR